MKAYAVGKSLHSPKLSFFHYLVFHGKEVQDAPFWRMADPFVGNGLTNPLYLIRNARDIPSVFMPNITLIVSEAVKGKIEALPHTFFLPVHFHKVVNFPVYPAGDFSVASSPEYKKVLRKTNDIEHFLERLPDVPSLHGSLPPYYELVVSRLSDIADQYPSVKDIVITMKTPSVRNRKMKLSADLLRDYPVVWYGYPVFSETAFPLIKPYLDRDYFEVVEVEV